jgi:hypothetical protein
MRAAQQNHQAREHGGEASRLRRAMLDAYGKSLRSSLDEGARSPVPSTLSKLIDELKRVDETRRQTGKT